MCFTAQSRSLLSLAHCIGVDRTVRPTVINTCTKLPAVSSSCSAVRNA